jgi:3-phytase
MKKLLALGALLAMSVSAAAGTVNVKAKELAALPDGGWLALDKAGLHLLGAGGQERAVLPLRAKQLDTRALDGGVLAVVVDANSERVVPVRVDLTAGRLLAQTPVPAPAFGIEAACLYRDAQQLDHLFVIGKDGSAEQWVLHGDRPQLVRRLAMPAGVKHCRADDAAHTLYVSEQHVGLWAYAADAEGAPGREPVALRAPFGKLKDGAGALAVVPDGVAVLDAKGNYLHVLRRAGKNWQALPSRKLASTADQMASRVADSRVELLLPDGQDWSSMAQPLQTPTQVRAVAIVMPDGQTEPVARQGDAADDPAIWVHPSDPAGGRVLGTNKKQGLLVYDLQGRQTQLLEVGRLNNVDLRQNVALAGGRVDLAAATQRDDNSLVLFTIDANGTVAEAARIATGLDEIYGMCLYRPTAGGLQAFVNDKDGRFQQYRIDAAGGRYSGTLLRTFRVASQPEGCVVDDRHARLFLGEEKRGVWTTAAGPMR